MNLYQLTTGLLDRLVFVSRQYVENSGKPSHITGLVSAIVGAARGPNTTTEIVVGIK